MTLPKYFKVFFQLWMPTKNILRLARWKKERKKGSGETCHAQLGRSIVQMPSKEDLRAFTICGSSR